MNKENNTKGRPHTLPQGLVSEQIQAEILKQPKMSAQVAAHVARNLDTLLEKLKVKGVSMHAVCLAANLGNPDDRDSKALWKYRNPVGSRSRNYITQALKYVNIAEAIATTHDHPYTGSSGELLRRIFAGTSYAPTTNSTGDASIALKVILDEVTSWIARQVNLAQTYECLQRMSSQKHRQLDDASWQFELATETLMNLQWHGCRLELGYRDVQIKDSKSQPLILNSQEDEAFNLCDREEVSLFICVDNDGIHRPYLAFEQSLVAKRFRETNLISRVEDGTPDGPEFGDLVFEGGTGMRFRLTKEAVGRTVNLVNLDKRLQDAYDRDEPEELNPVFEAFLKANPEYASHPHYDGYGCWAREIRTMPVSADALAYLEEFLTEPEGTLSPAGEVSPTLVRASGKHLLHGNGALANLIAWFTKSTWLMYTPDNLESTFLGDDISKSKMAPPAGWIGVNPEINAWSAADLLWLRSKMFEIGVKAEFDGATEKQQAEYDELLQRLRNDRVAKIGG